jgi:hypothetical protein
MGAFRTVSERVFPETHKRLLSGEPGLVKAQEDRRDVPGNHRLGRDKGVLAQGDVADDGGVSAYAGAAADQGLGEVLGGVARVLAARGDNRRLSHTYSSPIVLTDAGMRGPDFPYSLRLFFNLFESVSCERS